MPRGVSAAAGAPLLLLLVMGNLPGGEVLVARRWGPGNHVVPTRAATTTESVIQGKPQRRGPGAESIHITRVAAVDDSG